MYKGDDNSGRLFEIPTTFSTVSLNFAHKNVSHFLCAFSLHLCANKGELDKLKNVPTKQYYTGLRY